MNACFVAHVLMYLLFMYLYEYILTFESFRYIRCLNNNLHSYTHPYDIDWHCYCGGVLLGLLFFSAAKF